MAKKKPLKPRPELGESMRVIGIDPSLTSTGVAVLDLSRGEPAWTVGSVRTKAAEDTMKGLFGRLDEIADGIEEVVGGWRDGDVVVIEGYMLMSTGSMRGAMIANWHSIAARVVAAGIEPVVIAPATRQSYAVGGGGKANSGKDRVIIQVMRRFPDAEVESNDEADAVFLAALGAELVGRSVEPQPLPSTHLTFERHFEPRHAE